MPKYRVQVEVSDLDELRRLLFPEERRARVGVSGVYIVRAKTAVTTACQQVLKCRMEAAQAIIEGALEELAEIMRTTPYPEEEEEANRALEIINKLAEKLSTDQTEAVKFCCKWMGKVKCQVQCTP
jgi:microcompartment protein CcmL/EutN